MPPARRASSGGVGRGRPSPGKAAAEQSSSSDADAAESSDDYSPPSRGGKSRRVDEPGAAGQRPADGSDSEQSAQSDRGAGPSDDEEEEEEEEGEISSSATIEHRSPCSTQQIANAQRWEKFRCEHHFRRYKLSVEQAEPDELFREGVVGGIASLAPVQTPIHTLHPTLNSHP